jgi:glycosyltransferase involved in cell wall biosynthesis
MRVAVLNQCEYPQRWEVLTERVRAALTAAGHEVYVFCPRLGSSPDRGATDWIVPMLPPGRHAGVFSRIRSAALPFNPFWVFWLRRQLRAYRVDVLIVRDLRLSLPGLLAGQRLGIPVILYLVENYAGMVRAYGKQRIGHWVLRQPDVVQALEFRCARRADRVWVVAEENAARLAQAGVSPERIRVIHNVPDGTVPLPCVTLGQPTPSAPLLLVFVGQVSRMRCLDRVLEGMARLEDGKRALVKLLVVGDGEELPHLRRLASTLGLTHQVEFLGWQPVTEIAKTLVGQRCIGIVPHHVNELTDATVPNKLFDYMAMGLPVLVTSARPLRRIVAAERCGWAVLDTPADIERGLRVVLETPLEELREMGRRGLEAVTGRYNWASYERLMCADVAQLGSRQRRARHSVRTPAPLI